MAQRAARGCIVTLWPWVAAAWVFQPKYVLGRPDAVLERMQRWRAVLGVVISSYALLWFGTESIGEHLSDKFEDSLLAVALSVPSCLLVMGGFVALTRPDRRRAQLRQMRRSGLVLLVFLLVTAVVATVTLGHVSWTPGWGALGSLLYSLANLWLLVFFLGAAYYVYRHLFCAVDAHVLLPAVLGPWMAWTVGAVNFFGGTRGVPAALHYTLCVGGPLTVTALAVWEVVRTGRRYGIGLRDGPRALPRPAPPHGYAPPPHGYAPPPYPSQGPPAPHL